MFISFTEMSSGKITSDDLKDAHQYCKNILKEYNDQQRRFNTRYNIEHEDTDDIQEIYSIEELKRKKNKLEELNILWTTHYDSSHTYSKYENKIIRARQLVLTLRINRIQAWLQNLSSENFEYAYITNIE